MFGVRIRGYKSMVRSGQVGCSVGSGCEASAVPDHVIKTGWKVKKWE